MSSPGDDAVTDAETIRSTVIPLDWHRATLWGNAALAARDIKAGDTVAINGSLRHRTVPGEDGQAPGRLPHPLPEPRLPRLRGGGLRHTSSIVSASSPTSRNAV